MQVLPLLKNMLQCNYDYVLMQRAREYPWNIPTGGFAGSY